MRRRDFIKGIVSAGAWPLAARAQQRARRIGALIGFTETDPDVQSWTCRCAC